MLAQEADDQLALDQEALDQLALDQEADDQLALDQEALDHEADDQLALDQEAWFQVGSVAAVEAQAAASKLLSLVTASVTTNRLSPAFGFARPSAAMAATTLAVPTPSAPSEL